MKRFDKILPGTSAGVIPPMSNKVCILTLHHHHHSLMDQPLFGFVCVEIDY